MPNQTPNSKLGVRVYLTLSALAGLLVGLIWWGGVRRIEDSLIAGGLTFIIVLVFIATFALMVKDEPAPSEEPRLK
jgi:hypothetical protein